MYIKWKISKNTSIYH